MEIESSPSSVHFKKLNGTESLYSVRIGMDYRAIGFIVNDSIYWRWIGHHSDYDRMTGNA